MFECDSLIYIEVLLFFTKEFPNRAHIILLQFRSFTTLHLPDMLYVSLFLFFLFFFSFFFLFWLDSLIAERLFSAMECKALKIERPIKVGRKNCA